MKIKKNIQENKMLKKPKYNLFDTIIINDSGKTATIVGIRVLSIEEKDNTIIYTTKRDIEETETYYDFYIRECEEYEIKKTQDK